MKDEAVEEVGCERQVGIGEEVEPRGVVKVMADKGVMVGVDEEVMDVVDEDEETMGGAEKGGMEAK